jgi:hypothetical protein
VSCSSIKTSPCNCNSCWLQNVSQPMRAWNRDHQVHQFGSVWWPRSDYFLHRQCHSPQAMIFFPPENFALSNLDVVHSEILVPRKLFIVWITVASTHNRQLLLIIYLFIYLKWIPTTPIVNISNFDYIFYVKSFRIFQDHCGSLVVKNCLVSTIGEWFNSLEIQHHRLSPKNNYGLPSWEIIITQHQS